MVLDSQKERGENMPYTKEVKECTPISIEAEKDILKTKEH